MWRITYAYLMLQVSGPVSASKCTSNVASKSDLTLNYRKYSIEVVKKILHAPSFQVYFSPMKFYPLKKSD